MTFFTCPAHHSIVVVEVALPAPIPSSSSPLSLLPQQLRLSKMFSKSLLRMNHIRPYWASASVTPSEDSLTIVTVLDMDDWDHLVHLAEIWQGAMIQHYSTIRRAYQANAWLARHVDLHVVGRAGSTHGGYQDARNMARLLSRTRYVAYIPATALWMTNISKSVTAYTEFLDRGDLLIVPTFAFPKTRTPVTDTWPTNKDDMLPWVDDGKMGLLDYHWPLNEGPTSYTDWRNATEPYPLPSYDFHYGPVYIATRDNHPWCEERFADEISACLYSTYLNGADLFVLPNDYIVRTGQEPENKLTKDERIMQVKLYKNFRIEQCVFFARQFDQTDVFHTERGQHVREECAKELRSLRMLNL
ncbi:hypothetical protein BX666DRAFT_1850805 [Dichotomocladium elegans]|nr:hypothetical protein BX666DRAFT_1850805 [Dichotomocladium elegans]